MTRPNLRPPRGVRAVRQPDGSVGILVQSSKTGNEISEHLYEQAQLYARLLEYFKEASTIMGFAPHVTDKATLMRVAQFWWRHTYIGNDDDGTALDRYLAFLQDKSPTFKLTSAIEPDALVNLMSGRWCDQGFPVVTMGERYFAALAATEVHANCVGEIQAPWKTFMIEVPDGLLFLWDPDEQKQVRITRILVQRFYGVVSTLPEDTPAEGLNWLWRWITFSETGQHIWRSGLPKDLLTPVTFREREIHRYYDPERDEAFVDQIAHDERLYLLIGRLVLNVCLALCDPDNVRAVGSSHVRYSHSSSRDSRSGAPEQRVYQLGKPIKVDCRLPLREYLEGHRATPGVLTAQFLVRGHWRSQPHGPKHQLRRQQWIQPYWKGPEDGPIPLRTHQLTEKV